MVSDWDDDGVDEIGLHRESTAFFCSAARSTLESRVSSSISVIQATDSQETGAA